MSFSPSTRSKYSFSIRMSMHFWALFFKKEEVVKGKKNIYYQSRDRPPSPGFTRHVSSVGSSVMLYIPSVCSFTSRAARALPSRMEPLRASTPELGQARQKRRGQNLPHRSALPQDVPSRPTNSHWDSECVTPGAKGAPGWQGVICCLPPSALAAVRPRGSERGRAA